MKNVLEYLERAAERHPDKIAFADPDKEITYRELVGRAKRIALSLHEITGKAGAPIPVFMGKGVDTICVFFGSVYAGCFYSLLDTKQPKARLLDILSTLEQDFIVTGRAYEEELAEFAYEGRIFYLEDMEANAAVGLPDEESNGCLKEHSLTADEEEVLARIRANALDIDPLYCNFTSGSTGVPKGVVVSHRSVIDFIDVFTDLFGITENDVIGNQAPFDFDVSVKDIYSTIAVGATMQIIPTQYFSIPISLLDFICDRHCTVLIWAVSAMCIISQLNGFDYKVPVDVKKVLFSGEVMPIRHLTEWQKALPEATFVNLYGPTEITCNCTYFVVDRMYERGEVLPSGVPFPNEKVFLLDEADHLVTEPNVNGEICVSGTALALGYYNNPEQTAKAFVQNPLNKKYIEPIYRTGDLAYYNEAGQICFASRKDFQIKHMGHRIELGEIEAAMDAVPEIERACCIFENNKIIAFYVGDIEKKELARKLGTRIPKYMVPNAFRKLSELPITKNGKIDRKALKAK
ncbi:MAG: amino acid adenylation domain-containing protein [Lachnospiraceae bacterium]|nr:amino acid adenylation domain-containing protein [Lachnospiraceae bacterium]